MYKVWRKHYCCAFVNINKKRLESTTCSAGDPSSNPSPGENFSPKNKSIEPTEDQSGNQIFERLTIHNYHIKLGSLSHTIQWLSVDEQMSMIQADWFDEYAWHILNQWYLKKFLIKRSIMIL